jgi:hypothetical protein
MARNDEAMIADSYVDAGYQILTSVADARLYISMFADGNRRINANGMFSTSYLRDTIKMKTKTCVIIYIFLQLIHVLPQVFGLFLTVLSLCVDLAPKHLTTTC